MRPALRRHDLKDVACADILFGRFNRVFVACTGEVRHWLWILLCLTQGPVQRHRALHLADGVHDALGGLSIGGFCRLPLCDPGRRNDSYFALHPIQNSNHRRAQQDRIRHAQRGGVHIWQMLDEPDHVIAQIAEKPRRRGRQVLWHLDPAFRDQRAQRVQRISVQRLERVSVYLGGAVDAAAFAVTSPDQIGFHPDNRIAPAHFAAGDAFQHKAVLARPGKLEHQRYWRVQISSQPRVDHLRFASSIAGLKRGEIGGE